MTRCPDSYLLQDLLDGELEEPRAREVRVHLEGCDRCAGELARYRRAFAALDHVALAPSSPVRVERVLARVLPSRVRRRRWVTALGWGYAGTFAACLAGAGIWFSQPGSRALLEMLSGEASRRLVGSLIFVLNAASFTVLSLANGWGLLSAIGVRLAPFGRALAALFSMPGLQIALWLAAAACVALLWWMRPRDKRSARGMRHVGVLGF